MNWPADHPAADARTARGVCPHDCPDTCALLWSVQGGRVCSVRGDPAHPPTQGVLCAKVSRYAQRLAHPERVLSPLKRVGAKGSGQFEPVSWDEALDDIALRLAAIAARNPEAIVPYSYAGTMGLVQGEGMAARFFHRLGASLLERTICASAGGEALVATYGAKVGMPVQQFTHSKLILIWGGNPVASSVHFWTLAQQARRSGAVLVCIDPRKSETAQKCQHHIALLPGTDGALALGLMHELVVQGWLDDDYLAHHVQGWPALRERALQWPPERAAAVCGITADEVCHLAQLYGNTRPAAIRLNYGMQRVHGGGNAVRLIALLPCLVGAWRERGGGLLLSASGWFRRARNDAWLQRPDLLGARTPRRINMVTIGRDLLRDADADYGPRIEALVVYNSNPLAVAPDSAQVARGMRREDLFTVVLEHFMTDTALHADYVLPATMQPEHWDAHTSYGHTWAMLNVPAVAPAGQARSNAAIFRALAARMGFGEDCFLDSDEALARGAFNADAVNLHDLHRDGWAPLAVADAPFAQGGFPTPSGKALACAEGLPLPDHVPNRESVQSAPQRAARYPLAMISPPSRHFLNSTFVNVASQRAAEREPRLEMHPQDAAARGIEGGAVVRVFNDRGSYLCKADVSERARPGVVNGMGIWWRKHGLAGTNVNELTSQHLTDMGGGPTFYDCLVEVENEVAGA